MTAANRLIIFSRYPEAGRSKTRLIPQLGALGAARLQRRLTERILGQAKLLATGYEVQTEIHYCDGSAEQMAAWLGPLFCRPQVAGDLGWKMRSAFKHAFHEGSVAVALVGSDIPGVNAAILQQAFQALNDVPVVLGPSQDGGYYLVGLSASSSARLLPLLFENMIWSMETVLAVTLRRLEGDGCRVTLLPTLRDVDRPEDLSLARELGLL